ncbi:MAG: VCBS repeat-containing protein, partial [Bacteroidota bacterium]
FNGVNYGQTLNVPKFDDVFASTILSDNNKILPIQGITTTSETSTSSNSNLKFNIFAMAPSGPAQQYDKNVTFPLGQEGEFYCDQPTDNDYRIIPKSHISGDFNGDGLTDVLTIEKQYYRKECIPQQEDPYSQYTYCDCSLIPVNNGNSKVYFIDLKATAATTAINAGTLSVSIRTGLDKLYGIDFNGDGKTDLMHIRDGFVRVYSLSSNNTLVQIASHFNSAIDEDKPILLGDYNGDGKADFASPAANNSSTWNFFVSRGDNIYQYSANIGVYYQENYRPGGNAFVNGVYMNDPLYEYHYIPQDFNGDGKTDILKHEIVSPWQSITLVSDHIQLYTNRQTTSSQPSFALTVNSVATNNGLSKYGAPLFVESNQSANLEYAYIVANDIFTYEFSNDHRIDTSLKGISNNGLTTDVQYERLNSQYGSTVYQHDSNEDYPYVNINIAPTFKVVKEVTRSGAGYSQKQMFLYKGAVSHVTGLGFLGFKEVKRSNWHGTGVGRLWN